MANRTVVMGGVWASGAPDVPNGQPPAQSVTYADSGLTEEEITAAWPFGVVVASDKHNEMMRRVTTLLSLIEQHGVLPWCPSTSYPVGGLAFATDGKTYRSLIEPNLNNDPITYPQYWEDIAKSSVPIGAILDVFVQADGNGVFHAPSGYLVADGTLQNITTYPKLFAVYGTMFGGDGATTFGIPDARGVGRRGLDLGRGLDPGRTMGSYQADDFKAHNHYVDGSSTVGDTFGVWAYDEKGVAPDQPPGSNSGTDSNRTKNTGGTETRMKNIACLAVIHTGE